MDVTHTCSTVTAAVNKHGIGFNMLSGKAAQLSFTLIPAAVLVPADGMLTQLKRNLRRYTPRPTTP